MTDELKSRVIKALRIGQREARANTDREECGELVMLLDACPVDAPAPAVEPPSALREAVQEEAKVAEVAAYDRANATPVEE
jgi:hypothetical protein